MSLQAPLEHYLQRLLSIVDDNGSRGTRLMDDARRLCGRLQRLLALNLIGPDADHEALELACYALQLPLRNGKPLPTSRPGPISLRDRSEQAAELLISALAEQCDPELLDRTARILRDVPHRSPASPEARLLADNINLDDFGLIGLMLQTMHLSRQNSSIAQLVAAYDKRRDYGYWDARLKDGFHFEPIRKLATDRLRSAQQTIDLLSAELREDQCP